MKALLTANCSLHQAAIYGESTDDGRFLLHNRKHRPKHGKKNAQTLAGWKCIKHSTLGRLNCRQNGIGVISIWRHSTRALVDAGNCMHICRSIRLACRPCRRNCVAPIHMLGNWFSPEKICTGVHNHSFKYKYFMCHFRNVFLM